MAKKQNTTPNKEIGTAQELYNFLMEVCNILRGPVSRIKYGLKDQDVFDRAYKYIEMYY